MWITQVIRHVWKGSIQAHVWLFNMTPTNWGWAAVQPSHWEDWNGLECHPPLILCLSMEAVSNHAFLQHFDNRVFKWHWHKPSHAVSLLGFPFIMATSVLPLVAGEDVWHTPLPWSLLFTDNLGMSVSKKNKLTSKWMCKAGLGHYMSPISDVLKYQFTASSMPEQPV